MKFFSNHKFCTAILLTAVCILLPVSAEKTKISGLYRYTLGNGLQLYVAENHAAPLVYIELAVKAGGIAQTPETTGVFHLYEHMMFEGDSRYPDGASMDRAVKDLGVTEQNATTNINVVNYFFTIPSDLLYKGLEFWSYAIREPALRTDELEAEKKVVISEIEGNMSDPGRIYSAGILSTLFPEYPWRLDPAGTPDLVRKATVDDLKVMLNKYYIPNNSALFVGGDVRHADVYEKVEKIYGSWKRGPDPWAVPNAPQLAAPFSGTEYRVMPSDQISSQTAVVSVIYRGPDAGTDQNSIYAATVFDELCDDPAGKFKAELLSCKDLQIPDADNIGEGYTPYRENGMISMTAQLRNPGENLPARAKIMAGLVSDKIIPGIIADKDAFTTRQFAQVKQTIKDYNIMRTETAEGLLSELQFWWVNTSPDFFFSYLDNLKKVRKSHIDAYLARYIVGKYPLVTVRVNPAVYEKQKQAFLDAGFVELTKDTAYWWNTEHNNTSGGAAK
jgi:zinc protease